MNTILFKLDSTDGPLPPWMAAPVKIAGMFGFVYAGGKLSNKFLGEAVTSVTDRYYRLTGQTIEDVERRGGDSVRHDHTPG